MYPFFIYLKRLLYFKNNCFKCVIAIASKNKLSKTTDLYSM